VVCCSMFLTRLWSLLFCVPIFQGERSEAGFCLRQASVPISAVTSKTDCDGRLIVK